MNGFLDMLFPQGNPFGMSQLLMAAAQNPEEIIPLLAAAGIAPPTGQVVTPEQSAGWEWSSQSVLDPGMKRNPVTGVSQKPLGPTPTPQLPAAPFPWSHDASVNGGGLAPWAGPPEVSQPAQPPQPAQAPAPQPYAMPASSPTDSGFPLVQWPGATDFALPAGNPTNVPSPFAASTPSLPMPSAAATPEAQGDPFPTPIGSPPNQMTQAGKGLSSLGSALSGVKAPSAPEAQRVSTPSAPVNRPMGDSVMLPFLMKMLGASNPADTAVLRLSQALPLFSGASASTRK